MYFISLFSIPAELQEHRVQRCLRGRGPGALIKGWRLLTGVRISHLVSIAVIVRSDGFTSVQKGKRWFRGRAGLVLLTTSIFTCADVKERKALNGLLGRIPGVLIRFPTIRLLPLSAQTLKIRFCCLHDLVNNPTPQIGPLGSRKRAGRAPSQPEQECPTLDTLIWPFYSSHQESLICI